MDCSYGLVPGWRSIGAVRPLATGVGGLVLLCSGVFVPGSAALETGLTVAGSLLLADAHIANWRMRRASCSMKKYGNGTGAAAERVGAALEAATASNLSLPVPRQGSSATPPELICA